MKKKVYGVDIVNNNIKIGSIVKCTAWPLKPQMDENIFGIVIDIQKYNKKWSLVHVHLSNSENRIYNQADVFSLAL